MCFMSFMVEIFPLKSGVAVVGSIRPMRLRREAKATQQVWMPDSLIGPNRFSRCRLIFINLPVTSRQRIVVIIPWGTVVNTDSNSTETTRSDLRKVAGWIGAWIIALPLLYILSIGPVIKLGDMLSPSAGFQRVANTAYAPLFWISQNSDPFQDFLWWYIFDLWRCTMPPLK